MKASLPGPLAGPAGRAFSTKFLQYSHVALYYHQEVRHAWAHV